MLDGTVLIFYKCYILYEGPLSILYLRQNKVKYRFQHAGIVKSHKMSWQALWLCANGACHIWKQHEDSHFN